MQLTPDEWWLTRLSELRNAIVHGDEVSRDLWLHDGHHQLNHIHDRLISLLRRVLARRSGDDLLELRSGERVFPRLAQEYLAELASRGNGPDDANRDEIV